MEADAAAQAKAATEELVKDYGPADGEKYRKAADLATRALDANPTYKAWAKAKGLLNPDDSVADPMLFRIMNDLGAANAEGGFVPGRTSGNDNPFVTGNVTAQSQLKRKDPDMARQLIRAAGKDPAKYGL
jgi:hypothetical protein